VSESRRVVPAWLHALAERAREGSDSYRDDQTAGVNVTRWVDELERERDEASQVVDATRRLAIDASNQQRAWLFKALDRDYDDTTPLGDLIFEVVRDRAEFEGEAKYLAGELAEAQEQVRQLRERLEGAGPVVWQYGKQEPTAPDGVVPLVGTPRLVTASVVRRPLRAAGPWGPVGEETTEGASGE